jgi:hypothetical protein
MSSWETAVDVAAVLYCVIRPLVLLLIVCLCAVLYTEVYNPEKEREAGISKSSRKSLRTRQH